MKCPVCGDNMELNDVTNTYNCIGCGKVIKKGNEVGEAKQVTKANNIISKKLASLAVGAVAFISIMGLALSNKKLNLNTNKADKDSKTNNNHIEGITNSDNGIGYSLFEKIVVQEVEEENVTITLALPEGYKPVKIDGTYYGEMVIDEIKPAELITNYYVPDDYDLIGTKGINKNDPSKKINASVKTTPKAESGWTISGLNLTRRRTNYIPATILNISLNKDFSKIIKK
jgi:hypothetical protein